METDFVVAGVFDFAILFCNGSAREAVGVWETGGGGTGPFLLCTGRVVLDF